MKPILWCCTVLFAFSLGMYVGHDIMLRPQPMTVIFQSCYIDRYWPDSLNADRSNLKELYEGLPKARGETRERMEKEHKTRQYYGTGK